MTSGFQPNTISLHQTLTPVSLDRMNQVIDLDRYPIHEPNSEEYRSLATECISELEDDGCWSLKGFIRPGALPDIAAMCAERFPTIHHSKVMHSLYGGDPDPAKWPAGHPRLHLIRRTGGFICADLIPEESDLWKIYLWEHMDRFLEEVFGHSPLHRYADPIACMAVNVMAPGQEFPWHFDSNEFTVTLMLQPSDSGGAFEYIPFIRTPEDERYDAVAAALAGDRTGLKSLHLDAGDMQLFKGRYTLHRVTAVEGKTTRMVAAPSYSTMAGMVGPLHRMLKSYGRAHPIHYENAGLSPDAHSQ